MRGKLESEPCQLDTVHVIPVFKRVDFPPFAAKLLQDFQLFGNYESFYPSFATVVPEFNVDCLYAWSKALEIL